MLDLLHAYERGHVNLGTLIRNLEALLESLQSVNSDWRNLFLREWGKLEDVHAVALDRGTTQLEERQPWLMTEAITELEHLVQLKLEEAGTSIGY